MRAVKGNKVYTISENERKRYQDDGYDIQDDSGAVIAYGKGKTVPYEQYMKVKEELDSLKAQQENRHVQDGSQPEGTAQPEDVVQPEGKAPDMLKNLSADELKAYAEANEIPVGNATSQAGILKKIMEAGKGLG